MAADAAEAVRSPPPFADLVLMDVRLRRGTDGIAAAAAIRAERPVPIVFCTAFAEDPSTRARRGRGRRRRPVEADPTEALRPLVERALVARTA